MALLSLAERKKRFKYLGYEYNEEGIRKLQKKYLRKQDVDGVYGIDTDRLLRHVYNVKKFTKNFAPEEFKCECGGRYCTGYPSYMKEVELKNLQSIRSHYGKPMIVTCGLRCITYNNKIAGSIGNSKHLTGYATDFYMKGVTDTLANRKAAIKWIKTLPNHGYSYGNGINSNGYAVNAPYMGNAIHTDTNKPAVKAKTPTAGEKIAAKAKSYCGPKTKETAAYKKAAHEVYGKGHDTYCHRFVGTVLAKCGYPKMDYSGKTADAWKKIMAYLKKNFTQVSSPRAGDIHVTKNKKGAYHIFIELGDGKKAEANSKKKYYPHIAKTSKSAKNWYFRAK